VNRSRRLAREKRHRLARADYQQQMRDLKVSKSQTHKWTAFSHTHCPTAICKRRSVGSA
jgi:hypothetical protein